MAAPSDMTTKNISGKYVMNKTRTERDLTAKILQQQGVGWATRNVIYYATISLNVNHYVDKEDNQEHINIDQKLTGGIGGTQELRTLDWQERPHSDHIFGNVVGKSRRITISDLENEKVDDFLTKGWTGDIAESGTIQGIVTSEENKWVAEQTWGFQEFDGERYYTRHLFFKHEGDEPIRATMVYDYAGPLDAAKA